VSNEKFKTLCAFLISIFVQLCIITFLLASIASAETLTWVNPVVNQDGSVCDDLSGIELSSNGAVTNLGLVTSKTVAPTVSTTYMVRAYDTSGNRSIWSNTVTLAVATPTSTPTAVPSTTPAPSATPTPTPDYQSILQRIDNLAQQLQRILSGQ
jgi:hypothetical protein